MRVDRVYPQALLLIAVLTHEPFEVDRNHGASQVVKDQVLPLMLVLLGSLRVPVLLVPQVFLPLVRGQLFLSLYLTLFELLLISTTIV